MHININININKNITFSSQDAQDPRRQQIGNNFLNAPLWRLRSTRPSTHTKATLRPTDYKPPHSTASRSFSNGFDSRHHCASILLSSVAKASERPICGVYWPSVVGTATVANS